ncbi:MAG: hypothetical protein PHD79_03640 [Aliarcobacter sp.]|nr:hypothetical protein [Aliarcobacter sp.]
MKKIFLLSILVSFSFANVFACKSESSLYLIADTDRNSRAYVAEDLIRSGACKVLYGFTIVHEGQNISKVRYGDTYYYTLTAYLKELK